MAVVESEEVVVVEVSFLSKPSLFSFDLLFVAFDTSSFCGDGGDEVVVVVVEVVDVVPLVLVVSCYLSLASSSSFFFGTEFFSAVAAAAAASLNVLHSLRCPPFFQ